MQKNRNRLETILHLIIVITVFCAIGVYFVSDLNPHGDSGAMCLKYFTTDSNIIAMGGSLCCLLFTRSGKRPRWVSALHFVGTVCMSLTFLTVIFFLAPSTAIRRGLPAVMMFFGKNGFILHVTTPVLSFITMLLARDEHPKTDCLWALLPVVLYSLFYLTAVVFIGAWDDWYGFTLGGHYAMAPVCMLVMYAVALLLASAERKLQATILKKQ